MIRLFSCSLGFFRVLLSVWVIWDSVEWGALVVAHQPLGSRVTLALGIALCQCCCAVAFAVGIAIGQHLMALCWLAGGVLHIHGPQSHHHGAALLYCLLLWVSLVNLPKARIPCWFARAAGLNWPSAFPPASSSQLQNNRTRLRDDVNSIGCSSFPLLGLALQAIVPLFVSGLLKLQGSSWTRGRYYIVACLL